MTTGRINQVAFLGDNTTRRSPPRKIPAAGPRRARKSILTSTSSSKRRSKGRRPQRRLHVLHPRARAITHGPARQEPAQLEHGRAARFAPRPRGGTGQRGTPSHSNSTKVGTQHRNPASPQALQGLGLKVMGLRDDSSVHKHGACRHGQPDDRSCAATYT